MHDQGSHPKNLLSHPISFKHPQTARVHETGRLLWFRDELLHARYPKLSRYPELVHGVFTRRGGVSAPPFRSLNVSDSVGDSVANVQTNLMRIKKALGARKVVFLNQRHGIEIMTIRENRSRTAETVSPADAVVTDRRGIALLVKQADCQAVIIFDPEKGVVANAHCGWRGNVQNILARAVAHMNTSFGSQAPHMRAAIGPSLGPCCAEFITHQKIFPKEFHRFTVRENHFDLWAISTWQLTKAGLRKENIEVAGICTKCRKDLFYSYRGEGKRTGRFATVAMLK